MDIESHIPKCVGIIMDGNRRWAKGKGLPSFEGHRKGYLKLKEVVGWAQDAGVGTLVVFAFSEENWNRAVDEVSFMMTLIREFLQTEAKEAVEKNIRIRAIGSIEKFPKDIFEGLTNLEKQTAGNTGITLVLAVSYGGRQEIVTAINRLLKSGVSEVSMADIDKNLYTAGLPDPDVVIRTSGEMRVSGFLPWQAVYSELFFTKTLWPDFSKEEFLKIIADYGERDRRMGK